MIKCIRKASQGAVMKWPNLKVWGWGRGRGRGELTEESSGIHGLWLTGGYKNRRGGVGAHLLRY